MMQLFRIGIQITESGMTDKELSKKHIGQLNFNTFSNNNNKEILKGYYQDEEGIEQSSNNKEFELIKNMLKEKIEYSIIIKVTGKTIEEVKQIYNTIGTKLLSFLFIIKSEH